MVAQALSWKIGLGFKATYSRIRCSVVHWAFGTCDLLRLLPPSDCQLAQAAGLALDWEGLD